METMVKSYPGQTAWSDMALKNIIVPVNQG